MEDLETVSRAIFPAMLLTVPYFGDLPHCRYLWSFAHLSFSSVTLCLCLLFVSCFFIHFLLQGIFSSSFSCAYIPTFNAISAIFSVHLNFLQFMVFLLLISLFFPFTTLFFLHAPNHLPHLQFKGRQDPSVKFSASCCLKSQGKSLTTNSPDSNSQFLWFPFVGFTIRLISPLCSVATEPTIPATLADPQVAQESILKEGSQDPLDGLLVDKTLIPTPEEIPQER